MNKLADKGRFIKDELWRRPLVAAHWTPHVPEVLETRIIVATKSSIVRYVTC
jgi:hypothetical protein